MKTPCGGPTWVVLLSALGGCGGPAARAGIDGGTVPAPRTLAEAGDQALDTLAQRYYDGHGKWNICQPAVCAPTDQDWGADALTYALYLRWSVGHDASIPPLMAALDADGPQYDACQFPSCASWSDVPVWDAVAAVREHEVTGAAGALTRAQAAFAYVDAGNGFALGACPSIDYQLPQLPGGGSNNLKTLETDSNYVKAAVLLYETTHVQAYLTKAVAKYAAVRSYFLDPELPLYTVYVFDDGTHCTQTPRRFFGSVNGNMIWNGYHLWLATGDASYRGQALATAQAVSDQLADAAGIYADLQAENDIVEPLVEAMFELASREQDSVAASWILRNAVAAASARLSDGSYGRFFDGPGLAGTVTAWQTNGGLALALAAAALDPGRAIAANGWAGASFVAQDIATLPSSLGFHGSGIALVGTIGDQCCEAGHARVFIDGTETIDQTGIWQNKSGAGLGLPDSVLFAWRWPAAGDHTLSFAAGIPNAKEGGSFLHVRGYYLVP
jgi:hypothetical protein